MNEKNSFPPPPPSSTKGPHSLSRHTHKRSASPGGRRGERNQTGTQTNGGHLTGIDTTLRVERQPFDDTTNTISNY